MTSRIRVGLIKAAPFQPARVARFGPPEAQLQQLLADPIFEIITIDGRADPMGADSARAIG